MNKQWKILLLLPPLFIPREVYFYNLAPEQVYPPLPFGLFSLGSFLKRSGMDVRMAPMHSFLMEKGISLAVNDGQEKSYRQFAYNIKSVMDRLLGEFMPDVAGISLMTAADEYAVGVMMNVFRKFYPGLPVILGGNHATFSADRLLNVQHAPDVIIKGEGEHVMKEILKMQLKLKGAAVPGAAYRLPSGDIVDGGLSPLLTEEQISYSLDHDILWLPEKAKNLEGLEVNLMCGRGCSYHCSFCLSSVMWRGKVRYRPESYLKKDVLTLIDKGVRTISICDDVINQSRIHFKRICKALKDFKGEDFYALTRLNLATDEDLKCFKKANISYLSIGLESSDPEVLRSMNKAIHTRYVEDVFKKIKEAGLNVMLNIMFGHPGSTPESDLNTIAKVMRWCEQDLLLDVNGSIFVPFPGTQAARDPRLRIVEHDMAKWNCRYPVCELTDENGTVTYSLDALQRVYETYLNEVIAPILKKRQPGHPVPEE